MKILMINSVCGIRSTGRICTDLATALESQGHEVKIAYGRENVPEQFGKYAVRIGSDLDVKLHGIKARLLDASGFGSRRATVKFIRWVKEYDPDVIHLHNIHGYYIHVGILFDYLRTCGKKIIWTLHDCWTFTGHSGTCDQVSCEKWKNECNHCPLIHDYPKSFVDNSRKNYIRKKELFTSVDELIFVTPSKWLSGLVKSSFFKDKKVVVIPNGVDTEQFYPLDSDFKKDHGIQDKVMLLGCASAWGKAKGLEDFKTLAENLDSRFQVVLVGLTKEQIALMPSSIICIERTQSIKELAQIYSAADLFVNLTYADVFPTVNIEALACETPVLTYDTGGCAECLHDKNGISFEKGNLSDVIRFLNTEYHSGMFEGKAPECTADVPNPYSKELSIQQYIDIIQESAQTSR